MHIYINIYIYVYIKRSFTEILLWPDFFSFSLLRIKPLSGCFGKLLSTCFNTTILLKRFKSIKSLKLQLFHLFIFPNVFLKENK